LIKKCFKLVLWLNMKQQNILVSNLNLITRKQYESKNSKTAPPKRNKSNF